MDGKKILDPENQSVLSSSLKIEMLHPLRVVITNRGPDTELLVANPVELSGKGRPRVFYDVTIALKMLEICIFLVRNISYCSGVWNSLSFWVPLDATPSQSVRIFLLHGWLCPNFTSFGKSKCMTS